MGEQGRQERGQGSPSLLSQRKVVPQMTPVSTLFIADSQAAAQGSVTLPLTLSSLNEI